MAVTLTEAAARHVSRYLGKRGKGVGVRLGVKTTGCSGLAYKLEYADDGSVSASVKVRADLLPWNELFQQVPGFLPVGREYSRPHWRNIWEWTRENERAASRVSNVRRRRL